MFQVRQHAAKLLNVPVSTFPVRLAGSGRRWAGPQMAGPSAELLGGSNRALSSSRDEEEVVGGPNMRQQDQKGALKAEDIANFEEKPQKASIF